ncbi:hypothetical protein [Chamaesiphon sp. OTE_8_metabat_110]|uniref:hypothetical protein n=1 Tax=Chamaesiphon sp. OTE_8_metabat_110 TaxID=2964696 RepID=UPI00286BC79D|nr:hypothetical protein [Chamaesiphon sp. OTE_8_metabat_110]
MNNINLIDFIGKEVKYFDKDELLFGRIEYPTLGRRENKEMGIAIDIFPDLTISRIVLYNNYLTFKQYPGTLPKELEFGLSKEQVKKLLGEGNCSNNYQIDHDHDGYRSELYFQENEKGVKITYKRGSDSISERIVGISLGYAETLYL